MKMIHTEHAPQAIGPYSQAVEAGGFLFVSGQIPLDPASGSIVAGTIAEQTHRIIANARAILEAAGCGLSNVVKTTVYLRNLADFKELNEAYGVHFPEQRPARATVEVSGLPRDVSVEIDFIAWRG